MRLGLRTLHPDMFSGTLFQDHDDKSAYMGACQGVNASIRQQLDIDCCADIGMDIANPYTVRVSGSMSSMSNVLEVNTAYTRSVRG